MGKEPKWSEKPPVTSYLSSVLYPKGLRSSLCPALLLPVSYLSTVLQDSMINFDWLMTKWLVLPSNSKQALWSEWNQNIMLTIDHVDDVWFL